MPATQIFIIIVNATTAFHARNIINFTTTFIRHLFSQLHFTSSIGASGAGFSKPKTRMNLLSTRFRPYYVEECSILWLMMLFSHTFAAKSLH